MAKKGDKKMDVKSILTLISTGASVVMPLMEQAAQLRKNKNLDEYVVALEATVNNELETIKKQMRALKIALIATGSALLVAVIALAVLVFIC